MAIAPATALTFLPFAILIGIWVAWNDMKFMKIPNKAVLALFAVFVIVGPLALPFGDYLSRYLHVAVVLAVTFVANMMRIMGAGDAKFLAAMAPFIDASDGLAFAQIAAVVLLAAFATHRLFRALPPVRRMEWASWTHPKFPMGLGLSGMLILYLALGAFLGPHSVIR